MSLRNVVILSFCNGEDAAIDNVQHLMGAKLLRHAGARITEALGVYKGTAEQSWVVEVGDPRVAVAVSFTALRFNQESVLAVNDKGEAALVYLTKEPGKYPEIVKLGVLVEVTEEQAAGRDHTQVGGKFYAIEETAGEHVLH